MTLVYVERDCSCPRSEHVHGTRAAYLYDACRCLPCRAANAEYARTYRMAVAQRQWSGASAWVNAVGTRRRMQALAADGWAATALAAHFDCTPSGVRFLKTRLGDECLAATAGRVRRVYDALWFETPTGNAADRTRRWAERAGYVESWRWEGVDIDDPVALPLPIDATVRKLDVDEVAVERAMTGQAPVGLTKLEREEAIRRLTDRGLSAAEIREAMRLKTARMVTRGRAALRRRAA